MTRTTPEQRAELARLLDAAMPGPWRDWGDMWIQLGTTRALIVAAVNALPNILADLEDAKAERDALAAKVDRVADEVARIADESQHEGWDSPRVRSIVGRIRRALGEPTC